MSRIIPILSRLSHARQPLLVVTHNGKFHLDELTALAFVKMASDLFQVDMEIKRTRDPDYMKRASLVLDVGGSNIGKYMDHHGADFRDYHPGTDYKLATAGIVWYDLKDYLLYAILGAHRHKPVVESITRETIFRRLILPVDIEDNGQGRMSHGTTLTLNEIVSGFNVSTPDQDNQFFRAFRVIQLIYKNKIREIVNTAVEDDRIFAQVINATEEDRRDGLLVLSESGPWLSTIRRHWDDTRHLKLCIYGDPINKDTWRIQTLPADRFDKFKQRCSAPLHLHGFHSGSFCDPTPLGDLMNKVIFVHANGFIGAIRGTLEDARRFARYWVSKTSTPDVYVPTMADYTFKPEEALDEE